MLDTIEEQIALHLRANFYPPVPLSMVTPAIQAIIAYGEDEGELNPAINRLIILPEGVQFRGEDSAPASEIADALRLWNWIDEPFEEPDFEL